MITSAIEKLISLGKIQTINDNDRVFSKENLHWVKPSEYYKPDSLNFNTLSGMVDFINEKFNGIPEDETDLMVVVDDFSSVSLHGKLNPKNNNERFLYARSDLLSFDFVFNEWFDLETFIISLQSQFEHTDELMSLLSKIGNIADENIIENKDDTLTQKIQVKTGLTIKSEEKITNPIKLTPFRTFREVEQPESNCIFRIKKTNVGLKCALYISDGDVWKLEAVNNIKKWLNGKIEKNITVIA